MPPSAMMVVVVSSGMMEVAVHMSMGMGMVWMDIMMMRLVRVLMILVLRMTSMVHRSIAGGEVGMRTVIGFNLMHIIRRVMMAMAVPPIRLGDAEPTIAIVTVASTSAAAVAVAVRVVMPLSIYGAAMMMMSRH